MNRIFNQLLYEMEKGNDTILVSIIANEGSVPRGVGSQMLIGSGGRMLGTIGGGAIEAKSEKIALELLKKKTSICHEFSLHQESKKEIDMICGGAVTVLFQYIQSNNNIWKTLAHSLLEMTAKRSSGWLVLYFDDREPALLDAHGHAILGSEVAGFTTSTGWKPLPDRKHFCFPLPIGEQVYIFGGGHCAQALAPLLNTVGFRVTIFEERAEYANPQNFPSAETIIIGDYTHLCDYLSFTDQDYIVIMTSGHRYDMEIQDQVLRGSFAYVGVIGSRSKKAIVNQKLMERGISPKAIAAVHSPIGTPIKAVTPEEIAISIAGEMIQIRAVRRENDGSTVHACPMH